MKAVIDGVELDATPEELARFMKTYVNGSRPTTERREPVRAIITPRTNQYTYGKEEAKDEIIEYISRYRRGRTNNQIQQHLKLTTGAAKGRLFRLVNDGELVRLRRGLYAVAGTDVKPVSKGIMHNGQETQIWNYLCENDCEEGIHTSTVVEALGIKETSVSSVFSKLTQAGYAYRVASRTYRGLI